MQEVKTFYIVLRDTGGFISFHHHKLLTTNKLRQRFQTFYYFCTLKKLFLTSHLQQFSLCLR